MFGTAGSCLVSPPFQGQEAALLALTEAATEARVPWHVLADLAEGAGSAEAILGGLHTFYDVQDEMTARTLAEHVTPEQVDHWARVIANALADGETRLVTVLDEEYPVNLRLIYNRPPFLFVRGALLQRDARAISIVGTRRPSPDGRDAAHSLAYELAEQGVTVVSGLAAGIDTEAHSGALEAGGRTIAVMGTGIERVYPAENQLLAGAIALQGALVSQFWPGAPPRRENFPLRNVVTSGLGVGTVVIEASGASGARMQARLALEHGKRLFLVEPLVLQEEWAQQYARRPGAVVVRSVEEVLDVLRTPEDRPSELTLF